MERRRTFKVNKKIKQIKSKTKTKANTKNKTKKATNKQTNPKKQNENKQTSERIPYTRPIKYNKKFSFGRIQHLIQ